MLHESQVYYSILYIFLHGNQFYHFILYSICSMKVRFTTLACILFLHGSQVYYSILYYICSMSVRFTTLPCIIFSPWKSGLLLYPVYISPWKSGLLLYPVLYFSMEVRFTTLSCIIFLHGSQVYYSILYSICSMEVRFTWFTTQSCILFAPWKSGLLGLLLYPGKVLIKLRDILKRS